MNETSEIPFNNTNNINPYLDFLQYTLENFDIEFNGMEDVESLTEKNSSLIKKIIDNEGFAQDIQNINNKSFENISEEFQKLFIELLLLQIYTWENGNKSDKKKLAKLNRNTPGSFQEYLNHIANDTKNKREITKQVENNILQNLLNN